MGLDLGTGNRLNCGGYGRMSLMSAPSVLINHGWVNIWTGISSDVIIIIIIYVKDKKVTTGRNFFIIQIDSFLFDNDPRSWSGCVVCGVEQQNVDLLGQY